MEYITRGDGGNNNMHRLYEASMRGYVSTLNALIQRDPLILHKISLVSFIETPLHISALLGHLDFTKAILERKPELAKELDSHQRSPLHLASAEGHGEIVRVLLLANYNDVCLVADEDGRIPLHLAAIRGRVEVIKELIRAKPESVLVQFHGDTVLHLCVKYNHLEALKILVASVDDEEFLNSTNHQGHTILHLSVTLKQLQTTSYLLSVPKIRVDVNSLMENGLAITLHHGSKDGQITKNNLLQAAAVDGSYNTTQSPISPPANPTLYYPNNYGAQAAAVAEQSKFTKLKEFLRFNSDRFEKTRGNLMVVATLIATMSFQVAVNPPGGSWQTDTKADEGCPDANSICKAGTAVHAYQNTNKTAINSYHLFIGCSTLSFAASMSIILLLISGVPLRNKLSVGFLVIEMSISVIAVAATYVISIRFVQAPDDQIFLNDTASYYVWFWVGIFLFIAGIHVLRFCWWLLKNLFRFFCWLVKKLLKLLIVSNRQPRVLA